MLARSGPIPTRGDWSFEVKWDGFRALVSTEHGLRVRSRRGWNMTELAPELDALPIFATLDGELCAFGPDGSPDFPLICERMLMRRSGIRVTYMVFDLLRLDGEDLTCAPYSERREQPKHSTSMACAGKHPSVSMMESRSFRLCANTSSRAWLLSE
jgi:bifunctional non-homologous end joining protein LigD